MQEIIFDTKYGKFAVSPTADVKFLAHFTHGAFHQDSDIIFLKHFLTAESVVVDIGAYIGTMAVPLSHFAKQVHAYEPVPATRGLLEKNISLNNLHNVVVYPFGLGSTPGTQFAHIEDGADTAQYSLSKNGAAAEDVAVEVETLDGQQNFADLLKIDAEGMEEDVLQGGVYLIEEHHPVIFCEINFGQLWAHGSSPSRIEYFLKKRGYGVYVPLGEHTMGRVASLALITGLLRLAFFLHIPRNYAFDIVAIPKAKMPQDIEVISTLGTLLWALKTQIKSRLRRKK